MSIDLDPAELFEYRRTEDVSHRRESETYALTGREKLPLSATPVVLRRLSGSC